MCFLAIYPSESGPLIHLYLFQNNPPALVDFHAFRCLASMPMRDRYLHSQFESLSVLSTFANKCQHYPIAIIK